ncbi:DUF4038 domain-containing protein [Domibacillus sp. A3M-37]|uniref:apiosidase-like domain-containing protein n=1 Tax=Domibacillus sp. A3M-37 TaxID=2962037 RepID=UPI0020B82B78|nr:DUF4038 domain-containing protein [Domibacillus sp. A3M-37]MCP3763716.1 DUF4038 domain-containing protein [Domibacillus sp. A3M-37]
MIELKISENNRHFLKEGKRFFYLADTVWSAFTNISLEEWEEYLNYRKQQGFNVLQINILQQWDASGSDISIKPFKCNLDGSFDYYSINEEYFQRAEKMVSMAVEKGFVPALVLIWCNYVPDTWASVLQKENKMPIDVVEQYVEYAASIFSKFKPIYLISGDTDFPSEQAIEYYRKALKTIKRTSPDCLTTLHIQGRLSDIPKEFMDESNIDFYMYQSGHNSSYQYMSFKLAQEFYNKPVKKPVLNSEPCYEQMGYSRKVYGRYSTFDVRKAAWQSILSGASAGITYGAHGIWSWHKKGKKFGVTGEGFDAPYDWKDALKFEGAWDYGFIKYIFDSYNLKDLQPIDIVLKNTEEIRTALTPDKNKIIMYIPYATTLNLKENLSDYSFTIIDLDKKRFAKADVSNKENKTTLGMHTFESDVVIIGTKEV